MTDDRKRSLIASAFLILVAALFLGWAIWLDASNADGWEGDDGGLTAQEVDVGRWGAAVEAQAQRGAQMQLTPPPAPPTTAPAMPGFSGESRNGRCVGAEPLLAWFSPGWDVARMSGIMYRESRCQPGVSNSCCHGLLQIHESWFRQLGANVGPVNIYDPAYNVRAAAYVWRAQGYSAWSTS